MRRTLQCRHAGRDKKVSKLPANDWTDGMQMRANDVAGQINVENIARGRRYEYTEHHHDRPLFDLMGKMQAWGKEKETLSNPDTYFYLDFLVDMEGYPEEMLHVGDISKAEHLALRLISIAEERKFWKTYLYYVNQYEFENSSNVENALVVSRTECVEYALRQSGIASPAFLNAFLSHGLDDGMLAGVTPNGEFKTTTFNDDVLNLLDGASVYGLLEGFGVTQDQVILFLNSLTSLKQIPVKLLDKEGVTVLEEKTLSFDEIPTLESISEAFGLEGGHDKYYYDVRNFFSTPGRMV